MPLPGCLQRPPSCASGRPNPRHGPGHNLLAGKSVHGAPCTLVSSHLAAGHACFAAGHAFACGFRGSHDHILLAGAQAAQAATPPAPPPVCSRLPLSILGGMSMPGFCVKKPQGLNTNPTVSTGMTGKSSGRGRCVTPYECQSTTSASLTLRSCAASKRCEHVPRLGHDSPAQAGAAVSQCGRPPLQAGSAARATAMPPEQWQ